MNNKKVYILSILFATSVAATQEPPTPDGGTLGSTHSSMASKNRFIPPMRGDVIDYTFVNSFTDVNSSNPCILFDPEIIMSEIDAIVSKEKSEAKSTSDVTLLAATLTNCHDNLSRKYLLSSDGMLQSKEAIKMAEQVGYHVLKVGYDISSDEKAHLVIQLIRFLSTCDGATSLGIYPSSPVCEQCSLFGQEVFKTSLYGVKSGCCGKPFPNKLPNELTFYLEAFYSFDFSKKLLSKETPGKVGEEEKENFEEEEKEQEINHGSTHINQPISQPLNQLNQPIRQPLNQPINQQNQPLNQPIRQPFNQLNQSINQPFSGGPLGSGAFRNGPLGSRSSSNVIVQTQAYDELNQRIEALKQHVIYLEQELQKSQTKNELLQKENSSLKAKIQTINVVGMDKDSSKASVCMAMHMNTQLIGLIENLAKTNEQHAVSNKQHAISNQQHAISNQQHAGANQRNAQANQQNAQSNVRNADANEQHAQASVRYADANRQHAQANQQNAQANQQNAQANQNNAQANQNNAQANQNNAQANQNNARANQNNARANQQNARANRNNAQANQQNARANQNNARANQQNARANRNNAQANQQNAQANQGNKNIGVAGAAVNGVGVGMLVGGPVGGAIGGLLGGAGAYFLGND